MLYRVIDETEMPALVAAFMERYEVVAPVKRGNKYVFSAVDSFDDIALDYPTTIASPKKYLLPAKETLFEFDAERNEVTDYADMLTEARQIATGRMVKDAEALGADAVVGMRYASASVMQGAAEVIAYGTAVKFV